MHRLFEDSGAVADRLQVHRAETAEVIVTALVHNANGLGIGASASLNQSCAGGCAASRAIICTGLHPRSRSRSSSAASGSRTRDDRPRFWHLSAWKSMLGNVIPPVAAAIGNIRPGVAQLPGDELAYEFQPDDEEEDPATFRRRRPINGRCTCGSDPAGGDVPQRVIFAGPGENRPRHRHHGRRERQQSTGRGSAHDLRGSGGAGAGRLRGSSARLTLAGDRTCRHRFHLIADAGHRETYAGNSEIVRTHPAGHDPPSKAGLSGWRQRHGSQSDPHGCAGMTAYGGRVP